MDNIKIHNECLMIGAMIENNEVLNLMSLEDGSLYLFVDTYGIRK